jgi:hypothetical protein
MDHNLVQLRKNSFIVLVIGFLLLKMNWAEATILNLNSERSNNFTAGSIGVSNFYEYDDQKIHLSNWFANFSFNKTKLEEDDGDSFIVNSRDFTLGGGFVYWKHINFNVAIFQSKTPETDFEQKGFDLDISYSNLEGKIPFSIGGGYGESQISQLIEFTIFNRLFQRQPELEQNVYKIYATILPVYWLFLRFTYKQYTYSASKEDLQRLFQSRFFNFYTSNLISSIAGLSEYTYSPEMIFTFNDKWDFAILFERSLLIVDNTHLDRMEGVFTRYFRKWSVNFGAASISSSQNSSTTMLLGGSLNF